MSWTAPTTRATGDLISASIWNIDLVNNLTWLSTGHGARAYRAGALSLVSGTFTTIGMDGETFDSDGYHDPAVNNSRLTIPAGLDGLYEASAGAGLVANATGDRATLLNKNGGQVQAQVTPSSAFAYQGAVATAIRAIVGDYLELMHRQMSGATLAMNVGDSATHLECAWQGF